MRAHCSLDFGERASLDLQTGLSQATLQPRLPERACSCWRWCWPAAACSLQWDGEGPAPLGHNAIMLLALLLTGCRQVTPLSFLVISMDTFRGDRIGRLGPDGASLTPSLDALAAQSLHFTSAWAPANETLFSHSALFTGALASAVGPLRYDSFRLRPDTVTFASMLSRAGWHTEAVVAGGHMSPQFGLNSGFRRYISMTDWATFQQTAPQAIELLDDLTDAAAPFLLFVHGYDAHSPYPKAGPLYRAAATGYSGLLLDNARDPLLYEQIYDGVWYPDFIAAEAAETTGDTPALQAHAAIPSEHSVPLSEADLDFLIGSYDIAISHADTWVGLLLAALEESGAADRTVVVVLGDHGEDLLEHGWLGHNKALHDVNLHIPLMIRIPGQAPAQIDTPVGLLDVGPTLLELAALPVPPDWSGTSLLSPDPDRVVISESARGEVTARSARARLTLPRAAAALPAVPPDPLSLVDAQGSPLPWAEAAALWPALETAP